MSEKGELLEFADSNLEKFYKNRKEIALPEKLAQNIVSGINFALHSGSAQKINGEDLYHVHVCVPIKDAPLFPNRDESLPAIKSLIEKLNNNSETVLLFHTQERVRYPGTQRNIITNSKGNSVFNHQLSQFQEPYKKEKYNFEFEDGKFVAKKPIQPIILESKPFRPVSKTHDTTHPVDLNMYSPLQLGFIVTEKGEYILENKQKIDIFVY